HLLKNREIRKALELLSADNNNAALVLADYDNECSWLRLSEREEDMEEYANDLMIRIKQLIEEGTADDFLSDVKKESPAIREKRDGPRMFLSYNHQDCNVANAMMTYLREHDFDLFFDKISMVVGDDIKGRVTREINDRDFFMVLLSENSLRSPWVCLESTVASTKLMSQQNRVIPVRLDKSLENRQLIEDIRASIERQIETLTQQLSKQVIWDTDIVEDRKRQENFRRQHGDMVDTYRSLVGIDISGDQFEQGMQALVTSLRDLYKRQ
ncbi:MAG: toll/interleukin-1 receptor domain-containing protein, partial [Chitinophaga rupis]